ncbi:MAG TPA: maleylpyruvate isomerase family mycothiol-dependent enzyme [Acidimicrobiia bacterium]|nr:maleylpyruvate isomerase family mycothiol-dependent enzyme [Acidimicrobiia bacterium]
MDTDFRSLLEALEHDQTSLQTELHDLNADDWFRPTPAKGWDVRDTIAHLADTDEIAIDTCTGGPRPLNDFAARFASAEDTTLWGVLRGRRCSGRDVLAWWEETSARERNVLAGLDAATRVPWGLGMRPPSFVTARLMEAWAHGLDVRAALGLPVVDTDALRHVAWLSHRALPYAFSFAGHEPPPGDIRVELTSPSGDETWEYGPEGSSNRITGPAGEFCRLFVQRMTRDEARGLVAEGEGAVAALEVARAFL